MALEGLGSSAVEDKKNPMHSKTFAKAPSLVQLSPQTMRCSSSAKYMGLPDIEYRYLE
jgi:hypothetical protein